jgi:hypothetical protein
MRSNNKISCINKRFSHRDCYFFSNALDRFLTPPPPSRPLQGAKPESVGKILSFPSDHLVYVGISTWLLPLLLERFYGPGLKKTKKESVYLLFSLSLSLSFYDRTEPRAAAALTGTGVAKGTAIPTRNTFVVMPTICNTIKSLQARISAAFAESIWFIGYISYR